MYRSAGSLRILRAGAPCCVLPLNPVPDIPDRNRFFSLEKQSRCAANGLGKTISEQFLEVQRIPANRMGLEIVINNIQQHRQHMSVFISRDNRRGPHDAGARLLSEADVDRIIEMAWQDRTPFDAIQAQFGLREDQVRSLMKSQLKLGSYKAWRTRVEACKTKHGKTRDPHIIRFKSKLQRTITSNKISKRRPQ